MCSPRTPLVATATVPFTTRVARYVHFPGQPPTANLAKSRSLPDFDIGHSQSAGWTSIHGQFGRRFCRNASMPSRASSETNSSADCSVSSLGVAGRSRPGSARSSAPSTPPGPAASPCAIVGGQLGHASASTSSAAMRDQPDLGGLVGAELLAGHEVAARGARGHLRQQRQRDDRRRHPDPRLGQREGAVAARRPTMSHAPTRPRPPARTCPSIARDHRHRQLEDRAQQPASARAPGRRPVSAGVAAGGFAQVGARAERAAGVAQHDRPHRRVGGRVAQPVRAAARPAPWTARCGCAASPASAARRDPSTA